METEEETKTACPYKQPAQENFTFFFACKPGGLANPTLIRDFTEVIVKHADKGHIFFAEVLSKVEAPVKFEVLSSPVS
jgi:hypothetical protein